MNPRRTQTMTHFGPLFLTALGGWMAFHLVNSGSLYLVPGLIVAALLAYGGTLVALRMQTARDLPATHPATRTTGQFPTVAPRMPARFSPRSAYNAMDIAAGD